MVPPACKIPADIARVQLLEIAANQSSIGPFDAIRLITMKKSRAHEGANAGIHAWGITAPG